jgi:hypothetical protein
MPFEIPAALGPILPLVFLLAVLVAVRRALRWLLARALAHHARSEPRPATGPDTTETRQAA